MGDGLDFKETNWISDANLILFGLGKWILVALATNVKPIEGLSWRCW